MDSNKSPRDEPPIQAIDDAAAGDTQMVNEDKYETATNVINALQDDSKSKDQRIEELKYLVEQLKSQIKNQKGEIDDLNSNYENRLKQLQMESNRRENILIMRLTLKDKELQECRSLVEGLESQRLPKSTQLRSYLLDPALNYMFEKMKKEVDDARSRVEEMQNEMNAWKFSADSITGKQLMAKCRQLHQENEELGKMISSGKIAKLESGLAMHKNYSETLKKSQSEIEEVLNEIEEEAEGLQNTVYQLQQKLQEANDKQNLLYLELHKYQNGNPVEHDLTNQS